MSQTSSTYVWRYEREGGPDGRPSAPLEHGDRSRLRAVMASSEFPGSHGPGNGKRGGGRDLGPSTPSKGEKSEKGFWKARFKRLRTAMGAAIAVQPIKVAGGPGCQASPPTQRHRRECRCRGDS